MALPRDQILEIVRDTIETLGFKVIESKIQSGRQSRVLKVVIFKEGDVSMEDCSTASSVLLRRLEVDDPTFNEHYELILESPGVDRKLASLEETALFLGKEARFVVKNPAAFGQKDNVIQGVITGKKDSSLLLKVGEKEMELPWDGVANGRLYFDIKKFL